METFLDAYITAALWSSTDGEDSDYEYLDEGYSKEDLAPGLLELMTKECQEFQDKGADLLAQAYAIPEYDHHESNPIAMSGHDFWLTRNGHGVGFWDRGLPEKLGDDLTDLAKSFGECSLYVGDDGKIYC